MNVDAEPLASLLRIGGFIAGSLVMVLAWRRPRLGWWLAILLAPLSFPVAVGVGGARLTFPLELLLVGWLGGWLTRGGPRTAMVGAPVAAAFGIHVVAMATAAAGSVDLVVSAKALLVHLLYGAVLLMGAMEMLGEPRSRVGPPPYVAVALVYATGLVPVLVWSLARHGTVGFSKKLSYDVAKPFFSNRLELAALLGMLLPMLLAAAPWAPRGSGRRLVLALAVALGGLSLVTLSSRSAWASLIVGLLMALGALRRPPVIPYLALLGLVAVLAFGGATLVAWHRAREHAPGPSVKLWVPGGKALLGPPRGYDLSLVERGNRLLCALRMGAARPVTGFGPRTYEQVYGTFQSMWDLTYTSTFKGDHGDAHSDLAGTFAEQGLVGLAALLGLYGTILWVGLRAVATRGAIALPPLVGVVAFMANSTMNSMLEFDGVTPLFWTLAAVLQIMSRPAATSPAVR